MKTRNILKIATVAFGTAALTAMIFPSAPLNAGDEEGKLAATIAKPKLLCHGIEMNLATAGDRAIGAGGRPVLELTACNTTAEPATATVRMTMNATSASDRMSRVPRIPTTLWQGSQTIVLEPRERKVFTIPVGVSLPAKNVIAVTLQDGQSSVPEGGNLRPVIALGTPPGAIVALSFSTNDEPASVAVTD